MFTGNLKTLKGRTDAWTDSLFVDHAVFRAVWTNFDTVVPDRLYRSNHPTPARLAAAKQRHGLKTLINLRGPRKCGSDALSREAAVHLGLIHVDAPLESRGAPHKDRILRLAEIYRTMRTPALIHCKSGADRAGLAAGLYIMLAGGHSDNALRQLSWRFGHFSKSRTGILDAFFILYARTAEGRLPFLDWIKTEYDEHALKSAFVAHGLASFITDSVLRRE